MSLLRKKDSGPSARPSLLITLKLQSKTGEPIDATDAWLLLHEAFKNNADYSLKAAEIAPDKHETSIAD